MSGPAELPKSTAPGPAMPGTHRHSTYVWFTDGLKGPLRGDCADPGCNPASRARELAEARAEIDRLRNAIEKETRDHKPSPATGKPCGCFLCGALRPEARRALEPKEASR